MFKIVTRVFESLAVLNLLFIWAFGEYLENNRPTHPVGNFTVEVQNHGTSIFISQPENLIQIFSWPSFLILLIIAGGLETARRVRK